MKKAFFEDIKEGIGVFIFPALFLLLIILLAIADNKADEKAWNNGFCECGGRWEYMQPIGHAYSTDYIYKCDKCGKTHEFSKVR